jgi:AraC-like DNA-binding protein
VRTEVGMQVGTAPLLEQHRIFHSRDAEETRAFLHAKDYLFDLPPRQARALDTRLNGIYAGGLYIGYVHYGSVPVEFSPGRSRSDTWLQLPLRGHVDARIGSHSIALSPLRAAIASPRHERCRFMSSPDNARIQVALTQAALIEQLTALLGETPQAPLDFAPTLDLSTGYGQSLARYLLMAAIDLDQPGSVLRNPIMMSMFEQLITTGLLLSHPHNYTDALERRNRSIAPRDVKRAIEYLEDHLDAPVTLAHLVEVSGVPGRTLLKHFRDSKGVSPMRYLRNARLHRIRQELCAARPGESVTSIALRWGITHMGRFAVDYRRRFGESPSHTLRQQGGRAGSPQVRA